MKLNSNIRMAKGILFRPLLLATLMGGGLTGSAWAGSTPVTVGVSGAVPILTAPSAGSVPHTVDIDGIYARADVMSTGDTVVLTYRYIDPDGDEDDSLSTVVWRYAPAGGGEDVTIDAVHNVPASADKPGTSTIVIPPEAVGAATIKVEIWEQSKTGIPRRGQQAILVLDTNQGAGGTTTPPGPIAPGSGGVAGGIFLASDNPTAGSGAVDYSRTSGHSPAVRETYVFRAWHDTNGNGVWDAGERDVTAHLRSISWMLDGSNATAAGDGSPVTLSGHAIPGATTDRYTVPVNSISSSGAQSGDQGFSLKVAFD